MIAYICTPYRAKTKEKQAEHIAYAQRVAREAVLLGHDVIVPHLYYPAFLNDDTSIEREIGMASARRLIRACGVIVIGRKYGISDGMLHEINEAKRLGLEVREVV